MSQAQELHHTSDLTGDIPLYTSPWVSGTRACAYFGPIRTEMFLLDCAIEDRSEAWYRAECELLEAMRVLARGLGANTVVGLEVVIDPFFQLEDNKGGLRFYACGTAAFLEPLR